MESCDFLQNGCQYERNKLGIKPIQELLDECRAAKNIDDINAYMVKNIEIDYAPFINFMVAPDRKDSSTNILYISGMTPDLDKSYFLNKTEYGEKNKEAYKKVIVSELQLVGNTSEEATEKAKLIMDFEAFLTGIQKEDKAGEDLNKEYNVITLKELEALTGPIDYIGAMKKMDLLKAKKIVATDPEVIKKVSQYFNNDNFETIKVYMEFRTVNKNISYLSKSFLDILN